MEIISCLLLIICIFPLAKVVGRIFVGRLILNPYSSVQVLLGLMVIMSFFAGVITHGKTILMPVVLLFIIQAIRDWRIVKQELNFSFFKSIRTLVIFSVGLTLVLVSLFIIPLGSEAYLTGDYLFYGKLSDYMVETGFETKNLNYFRTGTNYTEVYHYFDIWFYGLIQKVSGLNSNQSVFTGIFLVFIPVVYQAQLDLFNHLRNSKWNALYALIALILMIQLSGATFLFNGIFGANEFGDFCGINSPKYILLYAFFLVFVLVYLTSGLQNSFFLAGIYALCFTTVLPAYVGISGILFFKKYQWRIFGREQLKIVIPLLIIFSYLVVFYFLFSSQEKLNVIHSEQFPLNLESMKTRMNIVGKVSIYMILGTLPLIVLLLINRKTESFKRYVGIFYWGLLGSFVGLVSWSLIFQKADSVQLWSNFYYPVIGIIYLLFAYFLWVERKLVQLLFLMAVIALDVTLSSIPLNYYFTSATTNSVAFQKFNGKNIAFFGYYDPATNVYSKNDAVYFGKLLELMSFSTPKLISFSSVEIVPEDAIYEQVIRQSHIYQLRSFEPGKKEMEYVSYQDSMLIDLDIKYVAVNKKRSFPLVLRKWELKALPIKDEEFVFYRISKN